MSRPTNLDCSNRGILRKRVHDFRIAIELHEPSGRLERGLHGQHLRTFQGLLRRSESRDFHSRPVQMDCSNLRHHESIHDQKIESAISLEGASAVLHEEAAD